MCRYQIIPRVMFESDHLTQAYDMESTPSAHKLACVFLVMAVGVMFDLHRPPCQSTPLHRSCQCPADIVVDPQGERLFLLGRACLSAVGLEHSSPATVQALHLCGTYILNDKRMSIPAIRYDGNEGADNIDGNGAEIFWPMLGTAVKIAQSVCPL